MTEQIDGSSQRESSDNSEDYDDEEDLAAKHGIHLDSPNKHHYVVGAKSLSYVMQ